MRNIPFILFTLLVLTTWILLSIDYFNIYQNTNKFEDSQNLILENIESQDKKKEVEKKYLILHQGSMGWRPMLAQNLIKYHDYIQTLPFDGFITLGNSYTDRVMEANSTVTYNQVWREVKGLKNLYRIKTQNFMLINIHFPADFWNDKAWNRVAKNFAVIARVARELGFKGIAFDDEPYTKDAYKMTNFQFPTKDEVMKYPNRYEAWEKKGAEPKWVDYSQNREAYRNKNYNFKEHIDKITQRFKKIMEEMVKEYPDITVLVYFGASFAHPKTDQRDILTSSTAGVRTHEYKGAMFVGFKEGLGTKAKLYDMAERYAYRKDIHFQNSYYWRKYGIAEDRNSDVNSSYQWSIPTRDREDWSKRVKIGFMTFNQGLKNPYNSEYDTRNKSTPQDISSSIKKALKYSDGYVIYFCLKQNWLMPHINRFKISREWREAITDAYLSKLNN
jgi:hypothetical protein